MPNFSSEKAANESAPYVRQSCSWASVMSGTISIPNLPCALHDFPPRGTAHQSIYEPARDHSSGYPNGGSCRGARRVPEPQSHCCIRVNACDLLRVRVVGREDYSEHDQCRSKGGCKDCNPGVVRGPISDQFPDPSPIQRMGLIRDESSYRSTKSKNDESRYDKSDADYHYGPLDHSIDAFLVPNDWAKPTRLARSSVPPSRDCKASVLRASERQNRVQVLLMASSIPLPCDSSVIVSRVTSGEQIAPAYERLDKRQGKIARFRLALPLPPAQISPGR
jgi:hypothetical protein